MSDAAGPPAEQEDASVHRRILDALLPLRHSEKIAGAQLPPPSYIRRHLVEHAAAAGAVDDRVINPEFLAYADPSRVRAVTAAGVASPSATTQQLASFRAVAYRMRWDAPTANAAALGFANRAIGISAPLPAASDETSWQPLWASWPIGGDVIGLHNGWVRGLAVGELAGRPVVVSSSNDGTVRAWDLTNGQPLGEPLAGHEGGVNSIVVGALAGRPVVVTGGADGAVRTWDLADGQPLQVLTRHTVVNGVAVAELAGRPVVVSGGDDGLIRVWDLAEGEQLSALEANTAVYAVGALELDGRPVVVTGGGDGTIQAWDLRDEQRHSFQVFSGHQGRVLAVAAGEVAGRPVVVSGGEDGAVLSWDLTIQEQLGQPLTSHPGGVYAVAMGRLAGRPVVVSGGQDGMICTWDLAEGRLLGQPLTGHVGGVDAVAVGTLAGRPVVVGGGGDGTVRTWDLADITQPPLQELPRQISAVAVGRLAGRPMVIGGGQDGTVRAWDLADGQPLGQPLTGHAGVVNAVAVGEIAGTPVAVSGGGEGTLRIWDLAGGRPLRVLEGHTAVNAAAVGVLAGQPVVVSGGDDGTVRVWDPASGEQLRVLEGHAAVSAVAMGQLDARPVVVSGDSDGTVRTWDLVSGEVLVLLLAAHAGAVSAVAVAELAGRPVVVSGGGATVRSWDLSSGEPVGGLPVVHPSGVRTLAVGLLGGQPVVIVGCADGTVLSWNVTLREQLAGLLPIPGRVDSVAATTFGSRCLVAIAGAGLGALELAGESRLGRADAPATLKWVSGPPAPSETVPPDLAVAVSQLLRRYERTGDAADLGNAIRASREAIGLTRLGNPDYARYQSNLGLALRKRFERSGALADLDEAVQVCRLAVAATPDGNPDRAVYLACLGGALQERFERTGSLADLDEAVEVGRLAVAVTPAGNPDRGAFLADLGEALQDRFERTGSPADLDAAIAAIREALDASADYPDRNRYLALLGVALQTRYETTGSVADLNGAVEAARAAVAATPIDHPARAVYLANLGEALRDRFERTGALADLDQAVNVGQEAVAATPPGHPARAVFLASLGAELRARYELTGALADLDQAVNVGQEAVAATPADHPGRAGFLSLLGTALQVRFSRTGALADLDAAVEAGQQAIAATEPDHPGQAGFLSQLGTALRARYEDTGSAADLDLAIETARQAVRATPDSHPDRARFLASLGSALLDRYRRTRELGDLDEAVAVLRGTVEATPADQPDLASYLSDLGVALQARFSRTADDRDLEQAVSACQHAAAMETASASVRVRAARRWGLAAADGGNWAAAAEGYEIAVRLLSQVASRGLSRIDREYWLAEMGGIDSEAAATCLQAGQLGRAVELWEQSRGVLFSQELDSRTDVTDLAKRYPYLADRFTRVREDLARRPDSDLTEIASDVKALTIRPGGDVPKAPRPEAASTARPEIDRLRELVAEFDEVVSQIRSLPGFHGFLLPPTIDDLLVAASQGPVVLVNVSAIRSDAILLTAAGVEVVPLPGLTPEAVSDQVDKFLNALDNAYHNPDPPPGDRSRLEQDLDDVLRWLWDELAGPVLDQLGLTGPDDGEPVPQMWWCLSGALSFLPVHAAGHHGLSPDVVPRTVLDRVTSSYTPTLRALIYARRPRLADSQADGGPVGAGGLLIVAMPETPGVGSLPAVNAEVEAVALLNRYPRRATVLSGTDATRNQVLAVLPRFRWAHFACHAASNMYNPPASGLLLFDYQVQPLTVVDVARLRLDDAELAFLSGCATARSSRRLADEAVHLGSGFQLAGYRHVVATLWPIFDRLAARVASDFYAELDEAGAADAAARALHEATRRIRARYPDRPSVWAAYIHSGA